MTKHDREVLRRLDELQRVLTALYDLAQHGAIDEAATADIETRVRRTLMKCPAAAALLRAQPKGRSKAQRSARVMTPFGNVIPLGRRHTEG